MNAAKLKHEMMMNKTSPVHRMKDEFLHRLDNVVFENTMFLEPKLDPDCPRRSVRAARLLLYDPDGSELNGKYGSAFQMTCNEGVHNSECVLTIVTKFLSSMDRALSRFSWSTSTMSL